jgi:hypothetical protein
VGLAFAAFAWTSVYANLHDADPFDRIDANFRPRAMRRQADDADYFAATLAMLGSRTLAALSAGPLCWQAHKPNAAAMNRTLAKFTDFMPAIQPARA